MYWLRLDWATIWHIHLSDLVLARFTTEEDVDYAIDAVSKGVNHMRDLSPIWEMYKDGIDLDSVVWSEH
jgi:cysteine desulfurase